MASLHFSIPTAVVMCMEISGETCVLSAQHDCSAYYTWLMSTTSYLNLLLGGSFFFPTSSKWVFIMFFSWPVETCRSLFLHAECSEVHWAAQIRAWCVDGGLQSESGSVSGCRDPADSSPGKPQLSGVMLPVADNNNNHFTLQEEGVIADVPLIICSFFECILTLVEHMSGSGKVSFILSHKSMCIKQQCILF